MHNEERYIGEWIEYHTWLGVDRFYLFDDDSTDNSVAIATSHPRVFLINNLNSSSIRVHWQTYSWCYDTFRNDKVWILQNDIDEFLLAPSPLSEYLKTLESPVLRIPRLFFGSNGHIKYDPDYVVSRFTTRRPEVGFRYPEEWRGQCKNAPEKTLAKVMYLSSAVYLDEDLHHIGPHGKGINANPDYAQLSSTKRKGSTGSTKAHELLLHHYVTKSREEMIMKMDVSRFGKYSCQENDVRPSCKENKCTQEVWFRHLDYGNTIFDDSMLQTGFYKNNFKRQCEPS